MECSIDAGDTAFVVVGAVLILGMMTALAFFTSGLLRSINTLSFLMAIVTGIIGCSLLWSFVGYSLVFGPTSGGFIGNFDKAFWFNVSTSECNPVYSQTIPEAAYAFFELMFATICPLLITGSYAERVSARHSLVFSLIWSIFVYYPVAHWVWGHGGWLQVRGVQDFAGGIVLHTSAGAASLVAAAFVGKRHGFDQHHGEVPPSNLPLAALGVSGLWTGWFFFNGASALGANAVAVSAALSTQVGAAMCCAVYYAFSAFYNSGRPSVVATMNGLVAGMAGITPASGYITVPATMGLGAVLGLTYWGPHLIKGKWGIDDALDVSIVHGLTGIIGSLAVGLISSTAENPASANGVFYGGHWSFLGWQAVAVVAVAAWSTVWTYLILLALNRVWPIRVPEHVEVKRTGLDIYEFGEFAYHGLRLEGNEPLFRSLLNELENSYSGSSSSSDDDSDDNGSVGSDGGNAPLSEGDEGDGHAMLINQDQGSIRSKSLPAVEGGKLTRNQRREMLLQVAKSSRRK